MSHEERPLFDELISYQERLSVALKAARICVFEVDLLTQRCTFLTNTERIFGTPEETILREILPFSALEPGEYQSAIAAYFSHPNDAATVRRLFDCVLQGHATTCQIRIRVSATRFTWCKLDATPIFRQGAATKMIGVLSDISEMKLENLRLEQLAGMDSFLDIYNKNTIQTMIRAALRANPRQHHALILLDLDHFKEINDSLGHIEGDRVLLCVSKALKSVARDSDLIGRFGGDEFILFLSNVPSRAFLLERLQLLLQHDDTCSVSKSIGVSIFPTHGVSLDTLLAKADKALYQSKLIQNTYTIC